MHRLFLLILSSNLWATNYAELGKLNQLQLNYNRATANLYTELSPEKGDVFILATNPARPIAFLEVEKVSKINGFWQVIGHLKDKKGHVYSGLPLWRKKADRNVDPNSYHFQKASDPPAKIINSKDGQQMLLIPEGPFVYGSQIIGANHYTLPFEQKRTSISRRKGKKRITPISLDSFYIDEVEISKGKFFEYIKSTGRAVSSSFTMDNWNLPYDKATYKEAELYCQWAGKSLPTELQWEKAARGRGFITENGHAINSAQDYPNGFFFDPSTCNTNESPYQRLLPANEVYDSSPYGVKGMCGNAAEWTKSWFIAYRGNTFYNKQFGRRFKVIRGGSYEMSAQYARSFERIPAGLPLLQSDHRAGFRCVQNTIQ